MRALLLVIAATSVAHAQAPGQVAASEPSAVMARRWSVDLALGGESLKAKRDGAEAVGFGGLELAARFRIRPAIEVALALQAAGNQGISTAGIFAEFRYHFMAERPWSPFACAALGIASAADKSGTDTEKKGRGALRLGGGIERRFGALGIEATLRLVGIAENKEVMAVTTRGQELARYGASGAELVIGGTYYW
jgi:hypothetical protein